LVQILLEGGAIIADERYNALQHAVSKKRLDIIELLVSNGADVKSVEMYNVFDTWDPNIMEYFIAHGADLETDYPMAVALSMKVRTAMGVFKRHKDRFPTFQEQANIALRYHCKNGDLKWASLMLWLGADAYVRGQDLDETEVDPEDEGLCALEYAALYGHFEIFKLKQIKLDPSHPLTVDILNYACFSKTADLLQLFIEKGFNPEGQEDKGTSLIQKCLCTLPFRTFDRYRQGPERNLDSYRSREKIKMIHLLAKHGAKWMPDDKGMIKDARSALLKMKPDYTVEFVWIMAEYRAGVREHIEELIRTPSIKGILFQHQARMRELIASF